MKELYENEMGGLKEKRDQMRWFVNKLISLSEKPIIINNYDALICFPVELLKEEPKLFPLGRYEWECNFESVNAEYASYCTEMLEKIKKDIEEKETLQLGHKMVEESWRKIACCEQQHILQTESAPRQPS